MPLLKTEADKLSEADLQRGVIEEIIDRESLFALLPFVATNGKSYDYRREGTLSEAAFLDPYEVVPEGAATFQEVSTRLRVLAGDVDMDKFIVQTESDLNPQLAIQIASKAKAVSRQFKRTLVQGDSSVNPKEFDGIRKLTPAGQTLIVANDGGPITAGALDELKDAVINGADVLMMRSGTWRAIRAILRSMGGNDAQTLMVPNFGYPVHAYDGTPVIINDYIPADETQGTATATTSVYALRLNEVDGFHALYGGGPAGLVVEDIGTIQNKDATRHRVKWYCGTALKATHSVARLKGVMNV